jgi:hypothetical protein
VVFAGIVDVWFCAIAAPESAAIAAAKAITVAMKNLSSIDRYALSS